MMRLKPLKYLFFCFGLLGLIIIAVPFAAGEIFSHDKDRALRIVYSGHLMGKVEPCG